MARIERTNEKYQRSRFKKEAGREIYNPQFVAEILHAEAMPPEAVFDNVDDLIAWLDFY